MGLNAKFVSTGQKNEEGKEIFKKMTGKRGKPAMFIKLSNGKYRPLNNIKKEEK